MWKLETEAAQFLFWEYINGIVIAVCHIVSLVRTLVLFRPNK
jgi:hypothetical protein